MASFQLVRMKVGETEDRSGLKARTDQIKSTLESSEKSTQLRFQIPSFKRLV
jgi:hypothetical protein